MSATMCRDFTHRSAFILFCFAPFLYLLATPLMVDAQLPDALEKVQFDWVCVTDVDLIEAYTPLASYRQSQGLQPLLLSLDEVIRWSPVADDTLATLRWVAGVVANQWGAEYLVLGGSHQVLPSPLHRLDTPSYSLDNPTDGLYRCLGGNWDVDGDGLYAEWDDDAAELDPHLSVGRIPADTPEQVSNVVAKIIAFENRPLEQTGAALFVASLMDPNWTEQGPYPNWSLNMASARRDRALDIRPEIRASQLFQGEQLGDPAQDPLNPVSLADSLSSTPHDLVYFQLNGTNHAWELAQTLNVTSPDFSSLENCGHSFIATMIAGDVADTREPAILSHLMTMPGGGMVAGVAPSGLGYMIYHDSFQDSLWRRLLDGICTTVGQAFDGALETFLIEQVPMTSHRASSFWTFTLLGDPATLIRSTSDSVAPVPVVRGLQLRAVPNPFNPSTTIQFHLEDSQQVRVEIFDLKGHKVATLFEGELSAGPQSVSWNEAPASGLYFARIKVANRVETVKLTLVE